MWKEIFAYGIPLFGMIAFAMAFACFIILKDIWDAHKKRNFYLQDIHFRVCSTKPQDWTPEKIKALIEAANSNHQENYNLYLTLKRLYKSLRFYSVMFVFSAVITVILILVILPLKEGV